MTFCYLYVKFAPQTSMKRFIKGIGRIHGKLKRARNGPQETLILAVSGSFLSVSSIVLAKLVLKPYITINYINNSDKLVDLFLEIVPYIVIVLVSICWYLVKKKKYTVNYYSLIFSALSIPIVTYLSFLYWKHREPSFEKFYEDRRSASIQ